MRVCCPIKAVNEANFAIHIRLIFFCLSFCLIDRMKKKKKGADPPVDFLAPPRWFLGVLSTSTRGSAPAARSDYILLLFRYYYTAHSLVYSLRCLPKPVAQQPIHVLLVLYCCCVVLHERQILFIFSFFFFFIWYPRCIGCPFFLKNVTRIYLICCVLCVLHRAARGPLILHPHPQGRFRYRLNSLFPLWIEPWINIL